MREQSHKHEMADALRGDFARLRARGVATTLEPAALETERSVAPAPLGGASAPVPPPPAVVPAAPAVAAEPTSGATAHDVAAPSWLQRVLGR